MRTLQAPENPTLLPDTPKILWGPGENGRVPGNWQLQGGFGGILKKQRPNIWLESTSELAENSIVKIKGEKV